MKTKMRMLAAVFLLIWVVAGCHSLKQSPIPTMSVETTRQTTSTTVLTIAPTVSRTPVASLSTPTLAPTNSPFPPTATKTLVLPPTPNPLPVISTTNAKETLEHFVQENGGCQLPCVMGLTPGESDQVAVDSFCQFFKTHSSEPKEYSDFVDIGSYIQYLSKMQTDSVGIGSYIEDNRGGVGLNFWQNRTRVDIGFGYLTENGVLGQATYSAGVYQHFGELIGDSAQTLYEHPYYNELVGTFMPSSILKVYGPPEQILILPFPNAPEYPQVQHPFDFILIYPEQGFLVEYISIRDEAGEYYVGCPTKSHILISTWDSGKLISLTEAVQHFSHTQSINTVNAEYFQPLQDVTAMSIDDFYEIFKDENTDQCVMTPKSLWDENP